MFTAFEASCCGYSAHRAFERYGWSSLVINSADIFRSGKEKYTKTDKIDALGHPILHRLRHRVGTSLEQANKCMHYNLKKYMKFTEKRSKSVVVQLDLQHW